MSPTFVQDAVGRSNRNRFFLGALIILIMAAGLVVTNRYWLNFIRGPVDTTKQAVLATQNVNGLSQYFVNVKGDRAQDTGLQFVERDTSNNSKTVKASYGALNLNDRLLLVKIPGDVTVKATQTQYTGALVDMSSDEKTQVVDQFESENDNTGAFLPFMLDTSDFRTNGYIALAVGFVVLLICIWLVLTALSRMTDHTKHPIIRALRRFGDPQQVADQINADMSNPHETAGKIHLGTTWLVIPGASPGLAATRFDDLVWAYGKVTQRRTNGIPTGKSYSAIFCDRYGASMTVQAKEKSMNEILQVVGKRAPWVILGYTPQALGGWKSNRAAMIAAVDQRRQQVKGASPTPTA